MNGFTRQIEKLGFVLGGALFATGLAFAQAAPQQLQQQQPAAPQTPSQKPATQEVTPLTLESAPPPVSAEEEAAIKVFRDQSPTDQTKKDQLAEDFLQKYPQSRYRPEVYSYQVKSFFSRNQFDKMEAAGDKELELTPNDPQTLAIIGSALPRPSVSASSPEGQKRLAKAEQYSQKALDLLPTLTKPQNMSDEVFETAKNQTAALAYSGLGLVAFRRGKFSDAIPNLDKAVKLDPQPDPVNLYLLGLCNQKSSHFDDAVAAFTKCAAIPGGMQATCTQLGEEAKKLAATQLSAPK
jgi:tetratricopeptide (TPR) repeat protein